MSIEFNISRSNRKKGFVSFISGVSMVGLILGVMTSWRFHKSPPHLTSATLEKERVSNIIRRSFFIFNTHISYLSDSTHLLVFQPMTRQHCQLNVHNKSTCYEFLLSSHVLSLLYIYVNGAIWTLVYTHAMYKVKSRLQPKNIMKF